MTRYQTILVLGVIAAAIAGCGGSRSDETETYVEPLTNVEYYTVTPSRFVQNITLPIVALPSREVDLGMTGGGRVKALHVDKGSRVRVGQVLLETDTVLLEAQLDMATATRDYQESEFARSQRLFETGSITQAQFDAARLALAQARSACDVAEKQLEDATLTAMFDGVITARHVEIGDMLSPGTPAFRIITMQPVKVQAGLPERYITDFAVGNRVTISFDAIPGREFEAEISYLSPEADSGVRTFLAEMEVANADGAIRAGLMGDAHILRRPREDVLAVPLNAIIETQDGPVVCMLGSDDTVRLRAIETLSSNETMVQVAGVEAGERIVARGQDNLVDGERVNVTGEYRPIIDEENGE